MALVESSHYSENDGLRQQVGRYSAPPPVRLQRGGLGRLAVALIAALGSGAAMFYAVTAVPPGETGGDEVVLTLTPQTEGGPEVHDNQATEAESISADKLNTGRQLALLAGAEVLPDFEARFGQGVMSGLETGSQMAVVDLSTTRLGEGLLIPSGDTAADPSVVQAESAATIRQEAHTDSPPVAPASTPADHGAVHSPLVVAARVPQPKHKPDNAPSDPANDIRLAETPSDDTHPQTGGNPAAPNVPESGFLKAAATRNAADPVKGIDQVQGRTTKQASAQIPASGKILNPAPWVRITERSVNGLLPVTGPNGETSRVYYARPFPADDPRPRISLVIGGLGLSQKATAAAIDQLPPEVTLAFAPYGKNLQASINRARSRGHEVLLELPMEPFDYPANDPGPYTLLTNNDVEQNTQRLDWLLAQFNGYVGVTNYLGAKFTSSPEALLPILRKLDERGLLVLDDGTSNRSLVPSLSKRMGIPYAAAARTIDLRVSRVAIDDALLDLEDVTRRNGSVVGMGYAYPVTIDRIILWADTLEQKGFVLAPVSANVQGIERDVDFDQHASSY